MARDPLSTYLNDHLAGAVAAIELIEHLERAYDGDELGEWFGSLRADIEADRDVLRELMDGVGASPSPARVAVAWLSEKVARAKLRLDDPAGGALRLLEALDAIGSGIEGKRSLWLALDAATEAVPALRGPDYARLGRRALEQQARVDAVRRAAARAAFADPEAGARGAAS
jgi:hypothetical protein